MGKWGIKDKEAAKGCPCKIFCKKQVFGLYGLGTFVVYN